MRKKKVPSNINEAPTVQQPQMEAVINTKPPRVIPEGQNTVENASTKVICLKPNIFSN